MLLVRQLGGFGVVSSDSSDTRVLSSGLGKADVHRVHRSLIPEHRACSISKGWGLDTTEQEWTEVITVPSVNR